MVKLSRRGASNGRSRRSLNKRLSRKQVLKGGAYNSTDLSFTRSKSGQKLYQLTIDRTNPNAPVYTLDFTNPGVGAMLKMKITNNNEIITEYYKNFSLAFGILDDSYREKIKNIITKLFQGGVSGASKRKLIITDGPETSVTLQLTGENTTDETISVTKGGLPTFDKYLSLLEDDVMPVEP